jgi:L-alanine-DL-glutamate epimerase-like enolase superfamily enzyme
VRPSRRCLLRAAAGAGLVGAIAPARGAPAPGAAEPPGGRLFRLEAQLKSPVKIRSLELLRSGGRFFARATSAEGAMGFAVTNQHASHAGALFRERVAPFFAGKDARDVEALVDGVHLHDSNYKLVGVPFWSAVSWAEMSLLDLMGKLARKPVGELLGGKPLRREVPMYLSSTDRGTTPEEEVARFEELLEATGARAVKFKVGGRMSGNRDASAGRTDTLVKLARKRLGDRITLYADANGSFDSARGIEVGRLLEDHGVSIYEEPCPFEDYASTRQVTAALERITVAGGEQDHSYYRFRDIVKDRVLDMIQPDLAYNGGFVRTTRVARLAARAGLPISPHCPQPSTMLYTLHLAAYTPNLGPFQEIHVSAARAAPWFAPGLRLAKGALRIPAEPGLGITIPPDVLAAAVPA